MKFVVILGMAAAIVFFGAKSCVSHRLDEKTFYTGHGLELKVITYFENLPLHFTGNIYRVLCKSEKTKDFPETKYNDAGYQSYVPIYNGLLELGYTPHDKMNINKLAEAAKPGYVVADDGTVIVESGTDIFITWDGCASFTRWSLASLPDSHLIESSPEFQSCMERYDKEAHWPHIQQEIKTHGSISRACKASKFTGVHKPKFSNLNASRNGAASARVESSAIEKQGSLQIKTTDFGKTWNYIFEQDQKP